MTTKDLRTKLDRKRGEQSRLETQRDEKLDKIKHLKRSLRKHERAREIVKQVGLQTQKELEYHISDVTTLALESVFEDPYALEVKFVERRGKTECDLIFTRDGQQMDPMFASGGGALDVAAFALRVASWSMQTPRKRSTIILDEPMKNLSEEYQDKGSAMLKEVSEKLGIQFIIITHNSTLAQYADKTFTTTQKKGITKIN